MGASRKRLVLLAITAGFVAGVIGTVLTEFTWRELSDREYDALLGIERDGDTVRMIPPRSMLGLSEIATDTNRDGRIDLWSVSFLDGEPNSSMYHLTDLDGDEKPDSISLKTGEGNDFVAFASEDEDDDQKVDKRWFALGDRDTLEHYFVYSDFDFDGRIDFVAEHVDDKRVREYVVVDFVFYNAQMTDAPERIANVYTDEGIWESFRFDESGQWLPIE